MHAVCSHHLRESEGLHMPWRQVMRVNLRVCSFPIVVLVSVLPVMAHAQTLEFSPGATYVVSARELRIPHHARDAYKKGLKYFAKSNFAGSLVFFRRAV